MGLERTLEKEDCGCPVEGTWTVPKEMLVTECLRKRTGRTDVKTEGWGWEISEATFVKGAS